MSKGVLVASRSSETNLETSGPLQKVLQGQAVR